MKVFFFLIITLPLLFVMRSTFAQSASMEKVVLLKCKGNLNVSQRVDDRRERSVNEALFAAEVRYKADEPKSLLVDLSGTRLLACNSTDSFVTCEAKREFSTVYGEVPFKGTLADKSAKYSFLTKATLNRLTGLMQYENISTSETTEPVRGSSRREESGTFECHIGTKQLL